MNRIILSILVLLLSLQVGHTQNTSSPYSRFGLGDLSSNTYGQFQSLGGTSIGIRNPYHLNFNNPASYTRFDTLNFTFEFGVHGQFTSYESNYASKQEADGNFSYMAIGFPVTSWWSSSFGLLPFSSVGYHIEMQDQIVIPGEDNQIFNTIYDGTGGLSQVYFGNGFELTENLSLGVNAKYLFGTLDHKRVINFVETDGSSSQGYFNTLYSDKIIVSDFTLDFGLQYYRPLNDKYDLTLGLVYSFNDKISGFSNQFIEKVNSAGISDTVINIDNEKDHLTMPQKIGFGFGISSENLVIAADYKMQNWSESTFLGQKDSLANSNFFSIGAEYTPNPRNIMNYWSRMRYRAGAHYANTYLNINGQQLNDFGISFGLGLPLRRTKSVINLGFDFGQRGTLENNLIKENYGVISLSLSLHDIWFMKRKFD